MMPLKFWIPLIACLGTAIILATGSCKSQPEKPTSYLNLAKSVQYTGKASCQSCHQKIYDSFIETGMGKSLYLPEKSKIIERFGPDEIVKDEASGYSYHPFWRGEEFWIREFKLMEGDTVHFREEQVDYIVGSGHQTRSYIMNREGRLYEMPITWYVNRQKWDLSPGYENGHNTRFEREIGEECMACHTGAIEFDEKTTNLFQSISLGIDCEKCHGPGQIHIERMQRDEIVDVGEEIDYSIVNPGKMSVQKQFDVCMQCHLQGVIVPQDGKSVLDFRPGMDLSSVYNIFIEQFDNDNAFGIASHAERLIQSQCYIQSGDQLTCTTCHDPHKSVATTDQAIYINQCQQCHAGETIVCSAPEEQQMMQQGNCITCHMPSGGTADIPHVTFTDHKIRVVKDTLQNNATRNFLKLVCMTQDNPAADITGKAYLLYFERNDPRAEYLTIARQKLAPDSHYEKAKTLFYDGNAQAALPEIDAALAQQPENTWFQFQKAEILELLGQIPEAKALYQQIYQSHPQIVEAGIKAGVLTLKNPADPGKALAEAKSLFTELVEKKPKDASILTNLGFVEMNSGRFDVAIRYFQQAISLNPEYVLARENLVLAHLQKQNRAGAQAAFDQLLLWNPAYDKREMLEKMIQGA